MVLSTIFYQNYNKVKEAVPNSFGRLAQSIAARNPDLSKYNIDISVYLLYSNMQGFIQSPNFDIHCQVRIIARFVLF